MFAPQTDTVCPTAKTANKYLSSSLSLRDVLHCPSRLSWSANFSAPLRVKQALVLGFMSPLSRWVSDHNYFTTQCKAVLLARGFYPNI
jgi:hypothetical protein